MTDTYKEILNLATDAGVSKAELLEAAGITNQRVHGWKEREPSSIQAMNDIRAAAIRLKETA